MGKDIEIQLGRGESSRGERPTMGPKYNCIVYNLGLLEEMQNKGFNNVFLASVEHEESTKLCPQHWLVAHPTGDGYCNLLDASPFPGVRSRVDRVKMEASQPYGITLDTSLMNAPDKFKVLKPVKDLHTISNLLDIYSNIDGAQDSKTLLCAEKRLDSTKGDKCSISFLVNQMLKRMEILCSSDEARMAILEKHLPFLPDSLFLASHIARLKDPTSSLRQRFTGIFYKTKNLEIMLNNSDEIDSRRVPGLRGYISEIAKAERMLIQG